MISSILSALGLSPLALVGIAGAVIAALGALWKTKRDSKAQGVAEERAKTDAANNELIRDKRATDEDVDRLREQEARDELKRWSGKP